MASISSLPDEVLVLIIQAMQWGDRARVAECLNHRWRHLTLTRGWEDVHHFDDVALYKARKEWAVNSKNGQDRLRPLLIDPLLSRFGAHLVSLALKHCDIYESDYGRDPDGVWPEHTANDVPTYLARCPNLVHLDIRGPYMTEQVAECIRQMYAPRLKSLCFSAGLVENEEIDEHEKSERTRAINEALPHFHSLELLHITSVYRWESFGCIILPSTPSMQNLRNVALDFADHSIQSENEYNLLSEETLAALGALPQLRSFTLKTNWGVSSVGQLRALHRLQHLCIALNEESVVSFAEEVLPHMGELKALEVNNYCRSSNPQLLMERLCSALAKHLPTQLEHLGVGVSRLWGFGLESNRLLTLWDETEAGVEYYEQLTKMRNLRSLELYMSIQYKECVTTSPRSWLERIGEDDGHHDGKVEGQLEYLSLDSVPQLDTQCAVVARNKKLRYMDFGLEFNPSASQLAALTLAATTSSSTAAAAADHCDQNGGIVGGSEERRRDEGPMPRLLLVHRHDGCYSEASNHSCHSPNVASSRLCLVGETRPSHVLDYYKFGCLSSEVKPPTFFN